MSNELTNQDLIDIVEDRLPEDRRELVRRALRENPQLAQRLKALHADREALRSLARSDSAERAPDGIVASALARAEAGGLPASAIQHPPAAQPPAADRARHRRPKLTRSRWPVAIAALLMIAALGGVSLFIVQATSPEARRARMAKNLREPSPIAAVPGSGPVEVAMNEGIAAMESEGAFERELDRHFDAMAKAREGDPAANPDAITIDLPAGDLALDTLLAEGVSVEDTLAASGLGVEQIGVALLEGRLVVRARSAAPERILKAAAALDGSSTAGGTAVAVRGIDGALLADRQAYAKPAATPAQGEPALVQTPPDRVEIVFSSDSDRAIGAAYAEFKALLSSIALVSRELTIGIDPAAPPALVAAPLDADTALWWEYGPERWVVPVPASFRLEVTKAATPAD